MTPPLRSAPGSLGQLSLRQLARRGASAALRLLAPDYCAACDAPVAPALTFCSDCGLCPPAPAHVAASAHVAGAYAAPLSTAILRMKFGQRTDLADRLCPLLPAPSLTLPGCPLVVPVPLHFARLAERGFNPAALLAKGLCERVSGQFEPRLLERTRDTPHQSRLDAKSRRANVEGAFRARRGRDAQLGAAERHAVLVDDVVTTGSTLLACRQALYAAGVVHVTVVALAAAPAPT